MSEVGVGSSLGGKSPILLSLAADSRYLIGLDLAHNQFSGAVVNLRGEIQKKVSLPVDDRNGRGGPGAGLRDPRPADRRLRFRRWWASASARPAW